MLRVNPKNLTKQTKTWLTLVFIVLNMTDAWLTQQLLAHNGVEMFWWSAHFNSNIFIKGLLAIFVGVILIRLEKVYLLKWLVIGMVFVVLSNMVCYLGYLGSWLYWQRQIATYP